MSHILGRRCSQIRNIIHGDSFRIFFAFKPAFCTSIATSNSVVTSKSNPLNHTVNDLGLFYKIDNELSLNCLFKDGGLLPNYLEECKTFNGTYVMIRKPALEILHCLKHTNFDYPVNRYILYGRRNCGVSMTMLHLIHYAHASEWMIVHVPKIFNWMLQKTERVESETKEGFIDLPALGSSWLSHFKTQNLNLINKLNLRIQNDYSWNIQEENKKGDSLLSLLDHGIARGKYSCAVIMALLEEIKSLSKAGLVKTLVAIDNYSVMFHPARKCANKKYKHLSPSQISFMESFKNMAKSDWHNGAVILSCHADKIFFSETDHLPLTKLSLKGFEFLYPFIPVEVPQLTDAEMTNLLEFYRSEKWILTSEADNELKVLSAGYIGTLSNICGSM